MSDFKNKNSLSADEKLKLCFQWIRDKKYEDAKTLIEQCISEFQQKNLLEEEGVFWSALGVYWRSQRDLKKAYKAYQKAEKCVPDDMSIKMISAHILLNEFHQNDLALRKLNKILQNTKDDFVMQHHAKVLKSIAFFQMGKKPEAKTLWQDVVDDDFSQLKSATNINLKACELFLKKGFQKEQCLVFLKKSLELAQSAGQKDFAKIFQELKKAFE